MALSAFAPQEKKPIAIESRTVSLATCRSACLSLSATSSRKAVVSRLLSALAAFMLRHKANPKWFQALCWPRQLSADLVVRVLGLLSCRLRIGSLSKPNRAEASPSRGRHKPNLNNIVQLNRELENFEIMPVSRHACTAARSSAVMPACCLLHSAAVFRLCAGLERYWIRRSLPKQLHVR